MLDTHVRDNLSAMKALGVVLSEDVEVLNSAVLVNLPGLEIYGLSGETWVFKGTIYVTTTAAAAAAFAVTTPVGSSGRYGVLHHGNGVPGTAAVVDSGPPTAVNTVCTASDETIAFGGTIIFGRRGLAKLQGTQKTATVGVTTIFRRNSFINMWQIVA
jgi:hypothetical protein